MDTQTIFVKGMVCNRCMMSVKTELESLGHVAVEVSLGEISFQNVSGGYDQMAIETRLSMLGFSLLEDKKSKLTREVKAVVAEVCSGDFDFPESFRLSKLVTARLGKDYEIISDYFIAIEKKTLEQYFIEYRVNKVKEFLVYSTLSLADIAFKLNFTSVAHLSTQFKQQTGLTPSFFKSIQAEKEKAVSPNSLNISF